MYVVVYFVFIFWLVFHRSRWYRELMLRQSMDWKRVTVVSLMAGAFVELGVSGVIDLEVNGLGILSGTFIAACLAYLSIETLKETKFREEKNSILLSFENAVIELLEEFDNFLMEAKTYRRVSGRRDSMREKWRRIEKTSQRFVKRVYIESIRSGEVSKKNEIAMRYMDYKASQEAEVRAWTSSLDEECLALTNSMMNRVGVCIKKYNYMVFRFEHYRFFLNNDDELKGYDEMGDRLHEKVGLVEDVVEAVYNGRKEDMNRSIYELVKVGDVGDLIGALSVKKKGYEEESVQYLKIKITLASAVAFVVGFYACSVLVFK